MHIYPWHIAPLQLSIDALNTATPHLVGLYICRTMHIYQHQMDPPFETVIDSRSSIG